MGRSPFIPIALTKGPFTIAEAREVGLERWHLQGASWRRLGRGTYAWAGLPDTTAARLDSAGKRLPPAAAFSGFTAAWLHGMDAPSNGPLEVTVPKEFGIAARSGMRVRQAFLDGCDVVLVRGKRVTAIERTIAEVCARLSLVEAVVFTDAALHSRRIAVAQLRAWVDARRGWPGVGKLRRVLSYC